MCVGHKLQSLLPVLDVWFVSRRAGTLALNDPAASPDYRVSSQYVLSWLLLCNVKPLETVECRGGSARRLHMCGAVDRLLLNILTVACADVFVRTWSDLLQ